MCFISKAVVPYRYMESCTEVILGSLMVGLSALLPHL